MRRYFALFFISVFTVTGFAACKKTPEKPTGSFDIAKVESHFADLRKEKVVLNGQSVLDVKALLKLVPKSVTVSYDEVGFDQNTGATLLTDVRITAADTPEFGLAVKELELWGVNADALSDRIEGKNLKDTLNIAKRIEATELELFGMETIFAPFMEATNALTENMLEDMLDGETVPLQEMNKYDATIASVIITDVSLHPWVLELTDVPEIFVEDTDHEDLADAQSLWHFFQKTAAWSYSLSYSDLAMYDSRYAMEMTQDGVDMDFNMLMPLVGQKDYKQGDLAYSYYRDMSYDMEMLMPSTDGAMMPMAMEGIYGLYTHEDFRLSKVMNHIARGVMPERTETDLMSLGVFKGENAVIRMGGQDLYSVEMTYIDLSQFHWLIPEVIDIRIDNLVYNISGFMDFMSDTITAVEAPDADVDLEMMSKVMEILEKQGQGAPSFDFNFTGKWNAETGKSLLEYGFGIDDFMRFNWDARGELPDYDAVNKLLPENLEETDEEALEALFEERVKFESQTLRIDDEGGLAKSFVLATEFAALAPEETPQTAFLRVNTPQQLRTMAGNSMLIAAPQVQVAFAPGVAYLQSFSDFITKGGSIVAEMKPAKPMGMTELEGLEDLVEDDAEAIVDILGLSVVHTPPK